MAEVTRGVSELCNECPLRDGRCRVGVAIAALSQTVEVVNGVPNQQTRSNWQSDLLASIGVHPDGTTEIDKDAGVITRLAEPCKGPKTLYIRGVGSHIPPHQLLEWDNKAASPVDGISRVELNRATSSVLDTTELFDSRAQK